MTDLSQLFARDPLQLTRDDISTIIETMRKSRHAFKLGNPKAGSTKPPTEKQKKISALADKLDIKLLTMGPGIAPIPPWLARINQARELWEDFLRDKSKTELHNDPDAKL